MWIVDRWRPNHIQSSIGCDIGAESPLIGIMVTCENKRPKQWTIRVQWVFLQDTSAPMIEEPSNMIALQWCNNRHTPEEVIGWR